MTLGFSSLSFLNIDATHSYLMEWQQRLCELLHVKLRAEVLAPRKWSVNGSPNSIY